jgi:CDP-2,3-bis-(O-geranylgeranyl)-sn-glycerol synthase
MNVAIIPQALWYFLPAYFANMAPNFFRKTLHTLAKPIDHGATFRGKRVFGDHKTYRGFVAGAFVAIVIILLQRAAYSVSFFQALSLIDYSAQPLGKLIFLGFLLGFGALLGDAVKSFFKRQVGVQPGKSWFPFDQLDFVIGGLLLSFMIYLPSNTAILAILILSPLLHVIVKYCGWLLKIDKEKF